MLMLSVLKASDVRNRFKQFVDSVVHHQPAVVKRHEDSFMAVAIPQVRDLLSAYRFTLDVTQEPDGSFSGSAEPIDVVANAPSIEELQLELARELIDYAREYEENFDLYYRSQNRRAHFPFILRVLLAEDVESVAELIDA